MTAVTPASWRTALARRLRDTSNLRFTTADLDEAGVTAFPAVFPKYYKYVYSSPVTVVNEFATVPSGTSPGQVIDVEDSATVGLSIGLPRRRGNAFGPITAAASVVFVSYEPLAFPATSEEVPAEALELLYLHAQATLLSGALIAKSDYDQFEPSNPDRVDENELAVIADQLMATFERRLDADPGMSLPPLQVV